PGAVRRLLPSLRVADAFGLGLFNATGIAIALESAAVSAGFAIVLGAVTGAGGGILRDVLCGEMPALLRPGEIYITACLTGGLAGLVVRGFGGSLDAMALTAAVVTIGVRLLAIRFGWRLGAVPGEPGP
ncbi:MAG TPA: TRIC cation channel family protein, partial [Myxococcota bacterium]|nr:TRIC cation channel family protein [Myxococcota bacterium]